MVGAVPMRIALWPTVAAQVASSFANRVTPAKVGGMATNVRYFQKQGIPAAAAVSAVGLNTLAGLVIHISALAVTGLVAGASGTSRLPLPSPTVTAVVVGSLIAASGLLMALPLGRKVLTKNLLPAVRGAASSVAAIAKTPSKLTALLTGSAGVTVGYTVAMLASLAAFGAGMAPAQAALVYLAGAAVATAAPTPGGIGATEAALVAGYTAAGVEASVAFAAVLLFRLVTFWLPILPGWWALVVLQRRDQL
jgi:undecaprenyl-diphosphatase